MSSGPYQQATRDQLNTPNLISPSSSTQMPVSSRTTYGEQSPPRKRQKILPSSPFRSESSQPCTSQSFKAASMEESVPDKSPAPRSNQGIEAEWPKRGRTNTRGRDPVTAPDASTPRSQVLYNPFLSNPRSWTRSVSPDTAKSNLGAAGMVFSKGNPHIFPSNMEPYLGFLKRLPIQPTPLTLKVYSYSLKPFDTLF